MHLLSNTLAFIFAVGVIIFAHELGHLLVAKLFDVRTLTFSLGFGKRIWGFRRGETDYRVSVIPLGGYVHFGGQDPSEASGDPREYLSKPRWQRVLILLAGPAMNVVLAIFIMAIVFMLGTERGNLRDLSTVIGIVRPDSPAEAAGLDDGDRILAVDGKDVDNWQQVMMAMRTSPDRDVEVVYERQGERFTTTVRPAEIPKYELGDAGLYPFIRPRVARVLEDSPAEEAGFRYADVLLSVSGQPISEQEEFSRLLQGKVGEEVRVGVLREGTPVELMVTPREDEGKARIGILISHFHYQRFPPGEALLESVRYNVDTTKEIFVFLGKIFERRISAQSALGGPIEIAAFSGAAARTGFKQLLVLVALISINLFIINLMPIPILDGGQILILLVEGTLRRDLSTTLKERMTQVGLVIIVMLMAMALYFDLVKNLPTGPSPEGEGEAVSPATSGGEKAPDGQDP